MRAITYTTARNNLANAMKQVCDDHDPVIITRKNNEAVVLLSLQDFEALNEKCLGRLFVLAEHG